MKKIMQFRYKAHQDSYNYPPFQDYEGELTKRNIFNNYSPISQLGIQGPPGLKFYLNDSSSSIIIGKTGIYELDLDGIGRINSIKFDEETLINLVSKSETSKLIIDIIYSGGVGA